MNYIFYSQGEVWKILVSAEPSTSKIIQERCAKLHRQAAKEF